MRVGELSRRSGVPIPTIKFYLREGLLPPGVATAANQADYDEEHLRRLKLIRAVIDVGGVTVAGAREVVTALGAHANDPLELLGAAQTAVEPRHRPDRTTPLWQAARERVVALIAERRWLIHPESPAIDLVADAIAAADSLGVDELLAQLGVYADTADQLAAVEVRAVLDRPDPASRMELVVVGTVLGEALFSSLRLLAHQHESARQLGAG
ncbi:MerR family transcriptional regulator [Actinoplanes sp. KI2]|uniref:MerR family transcriptional regulator n=1 Tax=Actinoplanes sp. KI2 TaxID=2983315 RepID=UPI0021D5C78E|nr:MerR family transcriptional regulator [Actinoplanes sp. KI2]MCU7724693.1 MerR family transcriptional regulator [Actinoplanes sp. KI2]